jgi:hypothetical protein
MAVPTQLSDLSATAASNSPAGGDTVGTTMDDFIRAHASIIARISAGTDALATPNIGAATGTSLVLSGLATVNGAFTSRGIDDNATAKALTLSGSGANSVTIANSAGNPTIGTSAGAIAFNPAGQGEALRVTTGGASTVNYLSISGATTGSRLTLLATGSDTNVGASWQTKGSGSHLFVTETGASAQVEIQHTAAANRYITLTGSNGGNPTIGTSAGSLAIGTTLLCAAGVQAKSATATPAGGAVGFYMGSDSIGIYFGSGAPTATAAKGSIYLRSDGSTTNNRMYVNTDGGTTWTAVTTAA